MKERVKDGYQERGKEGREDVSLLSKLSIDEKRAFGGTDELREVPMGVVKDEARGVPHFWLDLERP